MQYMQPGDTVKFQINYKNNSSATTDFYLRTDVIAPLEEKMQLEAQQISAVVPIPTRLVIF